MNKNSEQKKKEISNIIIKLIYRDGLDTVSFRKISNESGWSLGSIQNFFGNQQSLFIFIFKIISENGEKRMDKQNLFTSKIDFEEFINFSLQLLPLDREREIEFVAWTALVNKSLSNNEMRKVARENLFKNYEGIKQVFKLMIEFGLFKPNLNINKSTKEFYSFLEGLSQHSLLLGDQYSHKLLKGLVEGFVEIHYLEKGIR